MIIKNEPGDQAVYYGVAGLTVSASISKDGSAGEAISGVITDRGNGWYDVPKSAAEHNCDVGTLVVSAVGMQDQIFDFTTVSAPLSTEGIAAAVWAMATSALAEAGSIGKKLADWVLGTDHKAMLSTDEQTGVTIPTVTTVTEMPDVDISSLDTKLDAVLTAINALDVGAGKGNIVYAPVIRDSEEHPVSGAIVRAFVASSMLITDQAASEFTGEDGVAKLYLEDRPHWFRATYGAKVIEWSKEHPYD